MATQPRERITTKLSYRPWRTKTVQTMARTMGTRIHGLPFAVDGWNEGRRHCTLSRTQGQSPVMHHHGIGGGLYTVFVRCIRLGVPGYRGTGHCRYAIKVSKVRGRIQGGRECDNQQPGRPRTSVCGCSALRARVNQKQCHPALEQAQLAVKRMAGLQHGTSKLHPGLIIRRAQQKIDRSRRGDRLMQSKQANTITAARWAIGWGEGCLGFCWLRSLLGLALAC